MDTSNPSRLGDLLESVAARMVADFEASRIANHAGAKGSSRELLLLEDYLRRYLPRNVVAEHSGEVIAANGMMSGQCDIVILDPSTPPLWDLGNYRVVPAECLYGVIEVKSKLDSSELRSAWELIAKVKALPKTAFRPQGRSAQTRTAYGREWGYVPTVGMIFAYDGATLDTLSTVVEELSEQTPPEHSVDSVWVFNRGLINWKNRSNGKIDVCREPGSGYIAAKATHRQILLSLTAHLHEHFGSAWMPKFNIRDYMGNETMGHLVRVREWTDDSPVE